MGFKTWNVNGIMKNRPAQEKTKQIKTDNIKKSRIKKEI